MKNITKALVPALLTTLLMAGTTSMTGCKEKEQKKPEPPTVTVSKALSEQVTPYLVENGNTVAFNTIDLVARVSGYLESNNFVDGSKIKRGDLVSVIQPEPYANDLAEAQAQLDADMAEYTYDKTEYERQLDMYKRKATSLAEVQQWQTKTESAAAKVQGSQANVSNAEITYGYTRVFSPVDGRIGRHLVDPGNLVGNGEATKLASIEQTSPMYVYFSVNELDLLKLRQLARDADFDPNKINQVPLEVALQNEQEFSHKGHLDFRASEVEASTGTMQLRGILPNKDDLLLPGYYVKVRIALGKAKAQLTLPKVAIMHDQIGAYVFTVNGSNEVEKTRIITGSDVQDRVVILEGLGARDHVIIKGIQNASPGNKVKPVEKTAEKTA